jgi:serine protease inhibitor
LISDPGNHINSADKLVLINNFSFNAKFLNMSTFVDDCQFKEENDSFVYLRIENISLSNEYLGFASFYHLNFKACQLEYKKGFLMTILLPYDAASIDDIVLNSDTFEKILNQMKTNNKEYISLKIPKFKIQSEYEVTLLIQ